MDNSIQAVKEPTKLETNQIPKENNDTETIKWTAEEEKALIRRIDLHLLPGLAILYLFCFLDRT